MSYIKCNCHYVQNINTHAHTYVAYSGRYCNEDVDGCAELSCFTGVECEDIRAPGVGAMCGDCPDGFDGNGMKCTGMCTISYMLCTQVSSKHTSIQISMSVQITH